MNIIKEFWRLYDFKATEFNRLILFLGFIGIPFSLVTMERLPAPFKIFFAFYTMTLFITREMYRKVLIKEMAK